MFDFSYEEVEVAEQTSRATAFKPIPKGTTLNVTFNIQPDRDGSHVRTGKSGAVYYSICFTVTEGEFEKRKLFDMIGLRGSKFITNKETPENKDMFRIMGASKYFRLLMWKLMKPAEFKHENPEAFQKAVSEYQPQDLDGVACQIVTDVRYSEYNQKYEEVVSYINEYPGQEIFDPTAMISVEDIDDDLPF